MLCAAWPLFAAQPAEPCAAASTTPEINECLERHFAATDRELARSHQELLKRIADSDPQLVDRGTVRRLEEAQRSWTDFRRQDCEGLYRLFEGGSIRDARFHGGMIERTEKRIVELKNWDWPWAAGPGIPPFRPRAS
jgi:uncharacterized protein YecT (DUF1311 family)